MGSSASSPAQDPGRGRELAVFVFLTVVLAPLLSVALVGAYGLSIWVWQLFNGPPVG